MKLSRAEKKRIKADRAAAAEPAAPPSVNLRTANKATLEFVLRQRGQLSSFDGSAMSAPMKFSEPEPDPIDPAARAMVAHEAAAKAAERDRLIAALPKFDFKSASPQEIEDRANLMGWDEIRAAQFAPVKPAAPPPEAMPIDSATLHRRARADAERHVKLLFQDAAIRGTRIDCSKMTPLQFEEYQRQRGWAQHSIGVRGS